MMRGIYGDSNLAGGARDERILRDACTGRQRRCRPCRVFVPALNRHILSFVSAGNGIGAMMKALIRFQVSTWRRAMALLYADE
jgi:hypothetical protein